MANPSKNIHGLLIDADEPYRLDVGSLDIEEEKPLNYGLGPKDDDASTPTACIVAHCDFQVQTPIHINDNTDNGSDKVFCSNTNS